MLSRLHSFSIPRTARIVQLSLWTLLLAGVGIVIYQAANLAILANGPEANATSGSIRPTGGSLVIVGGGSVPDKVRDRFVELAGGRNARIVVIPTALSADPDDGADGRMRDWWKRWPVASLTLLHTRSKETANSPEFVRPIVEASGVWFNGGSQSNLSAAYLDTEVERQLTALLKRGGVIGGTSAGAAIMSRVMITSGRTEAEVGAGFDLLPGTVIDQHFLKRNRMRRLLGVVRSHPDLIGLGIDESTALVVDVGLRRMKVIGDSYVVAAIPEKTDDGVSTRLEILKPGDESDIAALRSRPAEAIVSGIDLSAM